MNTGALNSFKKKNSSDVVSYNLPPLNVKSLNYHQNNNSIQAIDLTVNSKDDVAHLANQ